MEFYTVETGVEFSVTWKDDVVRGVWKDGRVGTFRDAKQYKVTVTDMHLYTALQALKQGVWVPLEQTFQARGTEYADLDRVKVKLPALGVSTVVGPLALRANETNFSCSALRRSRNAIRSPSR